MFCWPLQLFTIIILVLSVHAAHLDNYDWDWMNCHNGSYVSGQNQDFPSHCVCNSGWTGTDCSLCANESVCSSGQTCDKTFHLEGNKAFNCTVQPGGIIPPGAIGVQWNFPSDSSTGTGVITVYIKPTGAPFLFNCSLSGCTSSYSNDKRLAVVCQKTSCSCSSWCESDSE